MAVDIMAVDDRTMRGVWVEDGSARLRDDIPLPEPPPGWALVETITAGICGTDLQILRGYADFGGVPGHEFVGRVVAGSERWSGRRVVGEINVGCGRCRTCRQTGDAHCRRRRVLGIRDLDGAFAQFLALPEKNLHVVPESVSDAEAAFVEPLAAALRVVEQVTIPAAARLLVVGDGRLGQLVARSLHAAGHLVEVAGRHVGKLERLARLGIHAGSEATARYDVAVECTGSPSGFDDARRALRPGGVLVLKSTYPDRLPIDVAALVVNEIQVVGSRCGPFAPALQALAEGAVPVADLIDATFPLERAARALEKAREPGVIKVQITSESSSSP